MIKYKFIDLFAGCGGLEDGFLQSGMYIDVAAVEWLKPQVNTLIQRLKTKWQIADASDRVMHFDIQREEELFKGWKDEEFGRGKGLDYFINEADGIDVIIGGPPCQAYSVAGRVRDENGMRDDYRNYLFEHYLNVVNRYRPKVFVFENVPGILSAAPNGKPITDLIRKGFRDIGYDIIDDLRVAKVNASDYGVPQNRERMIIVGVDAERYDNTQQILSRFYGEILPEYKVYRCTGKLVLAGENTKFATTSPPSHIITRMYPDTIPLDNLPHLAFFRITHWPVSVYMALKLLSIPKVSAIWLKYGIFRPSCRLFSPFS